MDHPDQGHFQEPAVAGHVDEPPAFAERKAADPAWAVVDLTEAYEPHAQRAVRTFTLADRKRLIVTDQLEARQPADLWWFLHTEAKVDLNDGGRTAVLSQRGKTFTVRLEEPPGTAFQVMECRPLPSSPRPEPQANNHGRCKLALRLAGVEATRIQVSLEP